MYRYEERKQQNDVTAKCAMPCVHQRLGYMISGPCENCASHTTEKYRSKHQDKMGERKNTEGKKSSDFCKLHRGYM